MLRVIAMVGLGVGLLAGCGSSSSSGDGGPPQAGVACLESARGQGACSEDAGQVLECFDAGWKEVNDCSYAGNPRKPCEVSGGLVWCPPP